VIVPYNAYFGFYFVLFYVPLNVLTRMKSNKVIVFLVTNLVYVNRAKTKCNDLLNVSFNLLKHWRKVIEDDVDERVY